jgi:hypothetical protein
LCEALFPHFFQFFDFKQNTAEATLKEILLYWKQFKIHKARESIVWVVGEYKGTKMNRTVLYFKIMQIYTSVVRMVATIICSFGFVFGFVVAKICKLGS